MPLFTQVNDTTYEIELFGKNKVEVGDREATDFKPHIKLNRWAGECSIDLGLATIRKILPIVQPDKIIWDDGKVACEFLPQPPSEKAKLDGFKFNITLKKKPKTNVSVLKFKAKGLKFSYQPALTPEKIEEGCVRPENVVGSYAVYHATRTNMHASKEDAEKYKCGKAFHWYRPLIWDATGTEVWGELNVDIEKGIRTVTIPQEFLDSAVYPVTIDDTFGYMEGGASNLSTEDIIAGGVYLGAAGTANSITALLDHELAYDQAYTFALYKDSDKSLIGQTAEETEKISDWRTLTFDSPPAIEAVDYGIVTWGNNPAAGHFIKYDSGTGTYRYYRSLTYTGTFPNPFGGSSIAVENVSIYCTYTPEDGNVLVTPDVIAQTLTEYVSILKEVTTPTTLSLVDTEYIPSINVGTSVVPLTLALVTTSYASILKEVLTPSTLALVTIGYIPVITVPRAHRNVSDDFWELYYEVPLKVTIRPLPDEIQFEERK